MLPECEKRSLNAPEFLNEIHLCAVVDANLNETTLLIVEDAVVRVLPVPVVVELHASCEALWILGRHQNPADRDGWVCLDSCPLYQGSTGSLSGLSVTL